MVKSAVELLPYRDAALDSNVTARLAKSKKGNKRPKEEGREGTRSILRRFVVACLNIECEKLEEAEEGRAVNK